jgi:hypothetical protein
MFRTKFLRKFGRISVKMSSERLIKSGRLFQTRKRLFFGCGREVGGNAAEADPRRFCVSNSARGGGRFDGDSGAAMGDGDHNLMLRRCASSRTSQLRWRRVRHLCCWLQVFAAIGVVATGCTKAGPREVHLQGEVTLNGAPVPSDATAFINFAPAAGGANSVSVPVKDGRYDSPQTPAGPLKVSFDISHPVGPERKSERTGLTYRDIESLVPAKYATGIQLDVQTDQPNQDFHLSE